MAVNDFPPQRKYRCWLPGSPETTGMTVEDTSPERAAEQFAEEMFHEEGTHFVMVRLHRTNLTYEIEVHAWLEINCDAVKTKLVKQKPRKKSKRKK